MNFSLIRMQLIMEDLFFNGFWYISIEVFTFRSAILRVFIWRKSKEN